MEILIVLAISGVAIITLLVYLCCSTKETITEGKVYHKEFVPAYEEDDSFTTFMPIGKVMIPSYHEDITHYKDAWKISIEGLSKEGKRITADYFVPKEVFDAINIGDQYTYDPNRDSDEAPEEDE